MQNNNFNTSQQIDVVFSVDDAYADYALVTMYSITKSNKTFKKIHFHVITNDMNDSNQSMIKAMERNVPNICVDFIFIDIEIFINFPLNIKHISPIVYGKFVIANALKDIDRVLYLDADTIIFHDLLDLWETNLEGKCIAGSHKPYINTQFPGYKEFIGLKKDSTYINAGVMLMNLKRIRELKMTEKLLKNAVKLRDIVRIQDQDIINITFRNEIVNVSKRYNYTDSDRREGELNANEVVIVHFNTPNKPWNNDFIVDDTNESFAKKYLEYKHEVEAILSDMS